MKQNNPLLRSIGNDIIDIKHINQERTILPKFYAKIITEKELLFYHSNVQMKLLPLYIYIWMCWAAKESAYKYLKRLQPEILFSALKFLLINIEFIENNTLITQVKFGKNVVDAKLYFDTDKIYCHTTEKGINIQSAIYDNSINDMKYGKTADFFLNKIAIPNASIIKNKVGYPELYIEDKLAPSVLSFSDDGRFLYWVAYPTTI